MTRISLFPSGVNRTPARLLVGATATLWWLVQPLLVVRYYTAQLARGAYPPEADSISIPIAQAWISWLVASPVVAAMLFLALRHYRAGAGYRAFDRVRPWRGAAIAVLAITATTLVLGNAVADYRDGYLGLALAQFPGLLALVWLYAGNVRAEHRTTAA